MSVQPNITNVPRKDANGKPIPDTSEGTLVRIRLFDDRERVILFKDNPSPTAKQVVNMVCQKLDLTEEAKPLFSLWIVGKELELQLRPKMELLEMTEKWPRWVEKYTHTTTSGTPPFKFVFKREAMVNRELESGISDEAAIKLLHGEARNNIMDGRYPLENLGEGVKLAAMQLLITHGDYIAEKHGPGTGFIQQTLAVTVPKYMLPKLKTFDWEQKIAAHWSNIRKKSSLSAYKDYLQYVMKWDCYGSTFFPACKNVPPQGFFELRSDHLLVGVNRNGLTIVDDDRHKVLWYGEFEGVEWECTPDSITIEYRPSQVEGQAKKKMASTIITPQAHLIDSLSSRSIYLIETAEKRKKKEAVAAAKKKAGSGDSGSATPVPQDKGKRSSLKPEPSAPPAPGPEHNGRKRSISNAGGGELGATMIAYDEKDDGADYLKAVSAARKGGK